MPEEAEAFLTLIDTFVNNHKVGTPVILSAGAVSTLHQIDKYARGKGYDSVILGNVLTLAVLNGDKIIVVWDGIDTKLEEVVRICKKENKAYMEIKTA